MRGWSWTAFTQCCADGLWVEGKRAADLASGTGWRRMSLPGTQGPGSWNRRSRERISL